MKQTFCRKNALKLLRKKITTEICESEMKALRKGGKSKNKKMWQKIANSV